ncbi:HflC protein [Myxococcus stipitatus DSM 14675]|uniref:Protein HflC n=1 Tax=Myxococcus stipitatus (strain DSM 14675 / JCM 12634 / Mx s8) TaxID=1278073 RepID=L7UDY8_MYXSD|nr:protease modulator HflC [Myxococcus stipitatus]AGC47131.1 HflC protein [Myxococcus stipitatus DSM 14675]
MKARIAGLSVFFAVLLTTAYSAVFVLGEAEQALLVRFGEIRGPTLTEPGIHWKWPFIDEVHRFDERLWTWAGDAEQISTLGREFILVKTSAHVRIENPRLFLESVHDERGAESRLNDILHSIVRNQVSGARIEELIRASDWKAPARVSEEWGTAASGPGSTPPVARGREDLEREVLKHAQPQISKYGMALMDVRIQRVNYIASVREQVENRMISERRSIAEKFRSEGRGRSEEILGEMERELQAIRSDASRKAEEVRGDADAHVTRLYGQAYGQNAEFFSFLKTLETYRETMGANTTLMIRADSDFYRYLESSGRSLGTKPAAKGPAAVVAR